MSATARQLNTPEVAAELWRLAESGDVDELLRLMPRVKDINVRNRHGMTALMKGAFFGHEPVVRVLLERGADPNLIRNDRFTALALAAFFGHAETVRTLIDFGAKTDAVTRCGASARTWAQVRTFDDVARCLEKHTPKPVAVAAAAAAPVVATHAAVKALKDPPEIWDLVQEAPRNFNPRSAFLSRIASMKRTFALGACAAMLLVVGGGIGLLKLQSSHAYDLPVEIPPANIEAETTVTTPPPAQPVVESPPVEVVNDNHARVVPNKARQWIRQPRVPPVVLSEAPPVEDVESREAPAVAAPRFESPKPSPGEARKNPNTALSPQVITPARSATPKAKVIQWP